MKILNQRRTEIAEGCGIWIDKENPTRICLEYVGGGSITIAEYCWKDKAEKAFEDIIKQVSEGKKLIFVMEDEQ